MDLATPQDDVSLWRMGAWSQATNAIAGTARIQLQAQQPATDQAKAKQSRSFNKE